MLGTISVLLHRCVLEEQAREVPISDRSKYNGFEPIVELAEESLKGRSVSHQVG